MLSAEIRAGRKRGLKKEGRRFSPVNTACEFEKKKKKNYISACY